MKVSAGSADVDLLAEPSASSELLDIGARRSKSQTSTAPLKGRVEIIEGELTTLEARVALLENEVGNVASTGAAPVAPPPVVQEPVAEPPVPPAEPVTEEPVIVADPVLQQQSQQQQQQYQQPQQQRHRTHPREAARDVVRQPPQAQPQRTPTQQEQRAYQQAQQLAKQQALEDESWLYGKDGATLLEASAQSRKKVGTLKERLNNSDMRAATLRSKVTGLENALTGSGAPTNPDQSSAADLKHRIVDLEDALDDLTTRTSTMENLLKGVSPR